MMDNNDKLLVSAGYTMDKELVEILSLQFGEASYDQVWQGFIGR